MSFPIVEQIAQKIATRLAALADVTVKRPKKLDAGTPEDRLILLVQGDADDDEELSAPGNPAAQAWEQEFFIAGFICPSDRDSTPIDQLVNVFTADIVEALCDPEETWHTWDDLAIMSRLTGMRRIDADNGENAGIILTLNVTYRVAETDHYTAR